MLLAAFGVTVASLVQQGLADRWFCKAVSASELGLLPFPMKDALLPGETLQIHLSTDASMALLETASTRDHGVLGQLIEQDEGRTVCAVAPLLELREHRPHPTVGVWCSFTCVGSVSISDVELRTAEEEMRLGRVMPGKSPATQFLVAQARALREPLSTVDYDSADDEEAFLAAEVEATFEEVNALRRDVLALDPDGRQAANDRTTSGGDRLGPPPAVDDRVEFGYRLGPLVGPYLELPQLLELRTTALCARGLDAPPDADLQRYYELWGTADAEAARRRLLSFVACTSLDERRRMGAAAIGDTSERLEHALRGLKARRTSLAAEVALMRATRPPRQ